MSTPTVTMSMEQYDEMKNQITTLGVQVTELQTKLADERLAADVTGRYGKLVEAVKSALEVIGFAVANLSPEIIRRWPYEQLQSVVRRLDALPDGGQNPHLVEYAREMEKFAVECQVWENRRRETPDRYVPPPTDPDLPSLGELVNAQPPTQS